MKVRKPKFVSVIGQGQLPTSFRYTRDKVTIELPYGASVQEDETFEGFKVVEHKGVYYCSPELIAELKSMEVIK